MKKFMDQITDNKKLFKHLRIAVLIGLILNIINHGEQLIYLDFNSTDILKVILTFIVPFAVSLYSAATVNEITESDDKIELN